MDPHENNKHSIINTKTINNTKLVKSNSFAIINNNMINQNSSSFVSEAAIAAKNLHTDLFLVDSQINSSVIAQDGSSLRTFAKEQKFNVAGEDLPDAKLEAQLPINYNLIDHLINIQNQSLRKQTQEFGKMLRQHPNGQTTVINYKSLNAEHSKKL